MADPQGAEQAPRDASNQQAVCQREWSRLVGSAGPMGPAGPSAGGQSQELLDSGPGVAGRTEGAGRRSIYLANFGINQAGLKREHVLELITAQAHGWFTDVRQVTIDTHVKRIRKKFEEFRLDPVETIIGSASRSGPDYENDGLALKRAERVRAALALGGEVPVMLEAQTEEGMLVPDGLECGANRAVRIEVLIQAPEVAFEADDVEVTRPAPPLKGGLAHGFDVRPMPPEGVMRMALRERLDDPAWTSAVDDAHFLGASAAGMNLAGVQGAPGKAGRLADAAINGAIGSMTTREETETGLFRQAWVFYLSNLDAAGFGFDPDYRLVDRRGEVVDTWWRDRVHLFK